MIELIKDIVNFLPIEKEAKETVSKLCENLATTLQEIERVNKKELTNDEIVNSTTIATAVLLYAVSKVSEDNDSLIMLKKYVKSALESAKMLMSTEIISEIEKKCDN